MVLSCKHLTRIAQVSFVRAYALTASATPSYFHLFPKSFPQGGPPGDPFQIKESQLRREYRNLQSIAHPDRSNSNVESAELNKAFTTLRNPYLRLAHIINLKRGVDITDDSVSKAMIKRYQTESVDNGLEYKELLMQVMEAHEQLELANSEEELEETERENEQRIEEAEEKIEQELKKGEDDSIDWDELIMDAIKLKYWVNIQNGIKEWAPDKPVHLTH
ncbi:hypothetical protein PVL30_001162 [Lodderomyces elongisporus]|uniref:uncharacterized protein n=1 Tax=Lodderomyces elongisporus TaxID=36914 RepID=UPI0029201F0A|nr:uncharacterized protein PVL30_001162 [Lodderomyces elongisporus]WLF77444.1 hypothetical protein PVL30_001162 [Lodderomyces elongisporus]